MRKVLVALWSLILFSGCATGIDAGGESLGENGGVAFIAMTVMLLLMGAVLWWILGREE